VGITGNDALALSAITHLLEEQVLGVVGKPTADSPDRVVKHATSCPFQDLPMDVCRSFDPICEFIWEKK
jgi:hypothetical protein